MKKLKNLGKLLNEEQQKAIVGGQAEEFCYFQQGQQCDMTGMHGNNGGCCPPWRCISYYFPLGYYCIA